MLSVQNGDIQLPCRAGADALGLGLQLVQLVPDLQKAVVHELAHRREPQALPPPDEQRMAQLLFQRGDVPAEGGGRHEQLFRRLGEAGAPGRRDKAFDLCFVHVYRPDSKVRFFLLYHPGQEGIFRRINYIQAGPGGV